MEEPAPYGDRDQSLLLAFIQRLTEVTKQGKIVWYHDSLREYRIRCKKHSPLEKLSICFSYENDTADAITVYIDCLPKTFTSADTEVWKSLKELEWAISEDLRSNEAVITSMLRELDSLNEEL